MKSSELPNYTRLVSLLDNLKGIIISLNPNVVRKEKATLINWFHQHH